MDLHELLALGMPVPASYQSAAVVSMWKLIDNLDLEKSGLLLSRPTDKLSNVELTGEVGTGLAVETEHKFGWDRTKIGSRVAACQHSIHWRLETAAVSLGLGQMDKQDTDFAPAEVVVQMSHTNNEDPVECGIAGPIPAVVAHSLDILKVTAHGHMRLLQVVEGCNPVDEEECVAGQAEECGERRSAAQR